MEIQITQDGEVDAQALQRSLGLPVQDVATPTQVLAGSQPFPVQALPEVVTQVPTPPPADENGVRTFQLPSGATATMAPFKGRHIREAQKAADGDSSKIIFAIIAITITVDGKKVVMEEIDDMDGFDVLELYSKFAGKNFTSAPNK